MLSPGRDEAECNAKGGEVLTGVLRVLRPCVTSVTCHVPTYRGQEYSPSVPFLEPTLTQQIGHHERVLVHQPIGL